LQFFALVAAGKRMMQFWSPVAAVSCVQELWTDGQ